MFHASLSLGETDWAKPIRTLSKGAFINREYKAKVFETSLTGEFGSNPVKIFLFRFPKLGPDLSITEYTEYCRYKKHS